MNPLQQLVDAIFAFALQAEHSRPVISAELRNVNAYLDGHLPALTSYLQSQGVILPGTPTPAVPSGPTPTAAGRVIQVINQSTVVTESDFMACVAALQIQVERDFAPLWSGLSCTLQPIQGTPGAPVPTPTVETIFVLDNSDQADALGYHEITGGDVPVGFCFAKTTIADGEPWQSCLSHELLEQLADPYVQSAVVVSSFQGKPAALAMETADPVENDSYSINGVPVSNFVTPQWFQDAAPAGTKFDFMGKLTAPCTLDAGGYIAYTPDLQNWQQYMPAHVRAGRMNAHPAYCRRTRRNRGQPLALPAPAKKKPGRPRKKAA